jgi:hypothetical protein
MSDSEGNLETYHEPLSQFKRISGTFGHGAYKQRTCIWRRRPMRRKHGLVIGSRLVRCTTTLASSMVATIKRCFRGRSRLLERYMGWLGLHSRLKRDSLERYGGRDDGRAGKLI